MRAKIYLGTDAEAETYPDSGKVSEVVANYFPGFTMFQATGYWGGVQECTLVIEILMPTAEAAKVPKVAKDLCMLFNQDCVLYTLEGNVSAEFVEKEE